MSGGTQSQSDEPFHGGHPTAAVRHETRNWQRRTLEAARQTMSLGTGMPRQSCGPPRVRHGQQSDFSGLPHLLLEARPNGDGLPLKSGQLIALSQTRTSSWLNRCLRAVPHSGR